MSKSNFGGSGAVDSRKFHKNYKKPSCGSGAIINTIKQLDIYLSGDFIECLLCGSSYKNLGQHLKLSHGMESKTYKNEFNIPVTRSLMGAESKRKSSESMISQWATNKNYEKVRQSISRGINTGGSRHESSSTITAMIMKKSGLVAKKKQTEKKYEDSRKHCIAAMEVAIETNSTLYGTGIVPERVYRYARKHPSDYEFNNLLSRVKKPRSNTKKQVDRINRKEVSAASD
jgi:hypothetical protein